MRKKNKNIARASRAQKRSRIREITRFCLALRQDVIDFFADAYRFVHGKVDKAQVNRDHKAYDRHKRIPAYVRDFMDEIRERLFGKPTQESLLPN